MQAFKNRIAGFKTKVEMNDTFIQVQKSTKSLLSRVGDVCGFVAWEAGKAVKLVTKPITGEYEKYSKRGEEEVPAPQPQDNNGDKS